MNQRTLLSLLVVATVFLAGCNEGQSESDNPFPQHASDSVYLPQPPEGSTVDGVMRQVRYAADGITPVSEVISLPDGTGREIFYRPDLTVWRTIDYFGAPRDGRIKNEIVYAQDGHSYVAQNNFREDGTRELTGQRQSDGRYQIDKFRVDGKTVAERVMSNATGKTEREETYSEAGTLAVLTEYQTTHYSVTTLKTYFNEDGTRHHRETKSTDTWSAKIKIETFYPGTDRVKWQYNVFSYGYDALLFGQGGEKLILWIVNADKVAVEYFDVTRSEALLYSQDWVRSKDDQQSDPNSRVRNYELESFQDGDYFVPPPDSDKERLARDIEFDRGANKPARIKIHGAWRSATTTLFLNGKQQVIRKSEVIEDEHWKKHTKDTVVSPPVKLEKPIDWSRARYQDFELPDFVEKEIQFRVHVRPIER